MLLDSWAWIEFFKGSKSGEHVREIIRNNDVYVSVLSLAEVADWCSRNNQNRLKYLGEIKGVAAVLLVDQDVAEKAGTEMMRFRARSPGAGLVDAIIYAQSTANGMRLVTGDKHFDGLEGVEFIGR